MSGAQSAPPAAGLQGPGVRVSVLKTPSGWWRVTVMLPNGAYAVSEHPTWDGAWERRHEMHAGLTQNQPPIRGDAWIGPRGRENAA